MKCLFSFFIFLFSLSFLSAQEKSVRTVAPENTFAVIIGIANYENESINLNYANRDAQLFANFLQSREGGAVPSENIRLLIDTAATTAAIYNALNWLRDKCELNKIENEGKPAIVYFYFSGHGDVETDTKANLGFLISFNTLPHNYLNNAVRLEDLNRYAHTMSVDLDAHVVIITDACHSGKLAGSDNKGSFLVGKELSTARDKEIRIASCLPDELSNEDERWGGGRGVFSYYLINGLIGLADSNNDEFITLGEIKKYVDSSMAADPVLKEGKLKQTPVLEGNQQFQLAVVNKAELITFQQSLRLMSSRQPDHDYFFSLSRNSEKIELLDFSKLSQLSENEIPFEFIQQFAAIPDTLVNQARIGQLISSLRSDPEKLKLFKEALVELLHTKGQQVINLYLEGDAAELERRRYYNSKSSNYDMYPAMYAVAMRLVDPSNPLLHILEVNHHYFSGVAARIKIPLVSFGEQSKLLAKALAAQKKALALESNAAYIHNEIGILYFNRKDYKSAEKYYQNATELAPSWAVPWANLCILYNETKNIEKSLRAGQTAESLQPGLQLANTALGLTYENSGNYLYAEEYYRKAIDINSRHYYPFERLGYVYLNTTQFNLADSFFYEADLRKRGYRFKPNAFLQAQPIILDGPNPPMVCDLDTANLAEDDIMAFFYWGMQEYEQQNYDNAHRVFKKVIEWDPSNPLVFHYIGKIFYDQQKWEEAELMFGFASNYYLDSERFQQYCDSVSKARTYSYEHTCFENYFRWKYYRSIEDDHFLADTYNNWSHVEEAEKYYRKIMALQPYGIEGYIPLWQMLEKNERYTEAESVIKKFSEYDSITGNKEMNSFYRRATEHFPGDPVWPYRLGLFLYLRSEMPSLVPYLDTIVWFPMINKEIFLDTSINLRKRKDLKFDVTTHPYTQITETFEYKEQDKFVYLPGVLRQFQLAKPIYTPRYDAIKYLRIADSLLTDTDMKADINFKIGNIYVRAGSKKQAYPYYKRSIDFSPNNANARLNFIDVCKAIYKNRAGLEQLAYLYDHRQINFDKRMLYAELAIHSSDFDKGKKLLNEAQSIYPYPMADAYDLMGRLYLLSNQTAEAIRSYKDCLEEWVDDPFTLYSLAKLHVRSGRTSEAWRYLESAMKNGFNYMYVLDIDATWDTLRKDPKWKTLLKKYPVREYYYPAEPGN